MQPSNGEITVSLSLSLSLNFSWEILFLFYFFFKQNPTATLAFRVVLFS